MVRKVLYFEAQYALRLRSPLRFKRKLQIFDTVIISDNDIYEFLFSLSFIYGPRQANLLLIADASSEGSGEPAHPRSLARTFAARSYKQ